MAGAEEGGRDDIARSGVERLTFFSDAVVAIAMTLLAIDLPVPDGHTAGQIWDQVRDNLGPYIAYLVSFFVVFQIWSHHHDLFGYAERFDRRLRTLNACWLLVIVTIPFATRTLAARGHMTLQAHALRYGFYSLVQALAAAALVAMIRHLIATGQAPRMPPDVVATTTWQAVGVILGFGLSIPLFFATTRAWVLWVVVPIVFSRLRRFPAARRGV